MGASIAAAVSGLLLRRIGIVVIQIPGLVKTDRLAAAGAQRLVAAPEPLLPLATAPPVRRPVAFAVPAVPHKPRPS